MKATKRTLHLILAIVISTAMIAIGCGQATVSRMPDSQIVSPDSNSNTQSAIDTKEPDSYRATLVLKAETTGERSSALTPLTAEVARMGADRRVSFKLLNGEQVIYLNRGNTRFIILPDRKQYAEINPEATGFDIPRLMMPAEIVSHLKSERGFERVGEEQMNGREVVKYRHTGTTQTGTRAGDVNAETFVYVDKETGLPVRTEFISEASKSVGGVSGVKVVTEMRDIKKHVEPTLFDVPEDMKRVTADDVREKVNSVMTAAVAIAGVLVNNMRESAKAQ